MRYIEQAYAKINLYLDVKDKRPDGYHEIESIMQQVSLHDTVSITKNDWSDENRITSPARTTPSRQTDAILSPNVQRRFSASSL